LHYIDISVNSIRACVRVFIMYRLSFDKVIEALAVRKTGRGAHSKSQYMVMLVIYVYTLTSELVCLHLYQLFVGPITRLVQQIDIRLLVKCYLFCSTTVIVLLRYCLGGNTDP
jgi:hypothetical protein